MSWRQRAILSAVICHFVFGLLSASPAVHSLSRWPIVSSMIRLYIALGFQQSWHMFSPPPQRLAVIQYSAFREGRYAAPEEPFKNEKELVEGSTFFLPRGKARLVKYMRGDSYDQRLADYPGRQFYYQQLGDYYCRGDGAIQGLEKIRFYLGLKSMPPFGNGSPEGEQLIPIYERVCHGP